MKEVFKRVLACDDMQVIKNCLGIMADSCEIGMSDDTMLETMKQVQGEVGACHYDEEMAKLHLCLIGNIHCIDAAKDYYHKVKNDKIVLWDWCVLWGEMVRQHGGKIRSWFPKIREIEFESKIYDECISFLDSGKLPYYDLKV